MYKILTAASLLLASQLSFATVWQLDNTKSSIDFTSTKNGDIQELNQFKQLSGTINDANGQAKLAVDLSSVDTRIPLRDDRLRELLFEVTKFPQASFTTTVDAKTMAELSDKQQHTIDVDGTFDLHGMQHEIKSQVIAQQLDDNTIQIKNAQPIIIDTKEYNMSAGIAALEKIAALKSIDTNVPVNFTLTFISQSP